MDRIAALTQMMESSPGEPFPLYGLALEYRGSGDHERAWSFFERLLGDFPDYLATYLMAGGTLSTLGRTDEARTAYQSGIELAIRVSDSHTRAELEAALADLPAAT